MPTSKLFGIAGMAGLPPRFLRRRTFSEPNRADSLNSSAHLSLYGPSQVSGSRGLEVSVTKTFGSEPYGPASATACAPRLRGPGSRALIHPCLPNVQHEAISMDGRELGDLVKAFRPLSACFAVHWLHVGAWAGNAQTEGSTVEDEGPRILTGATPSYFCVSASVSASIRCAPHSPRDGAGLGELDRGLYAPTGPERMRCVFEGSWGSG